MQNLVRYHSVSTKLFDKWKEKKQEGGGEADSWKGTGKYYNVFVYVGTNGSVPKRFSTVVNDSPYVLHKDRT